MLGWATIGTWEKYPPHPTRTMTNQQIRDLQAFAVELAREGRTEAAREVLALIARS